MRTDEIWKWIDAILNLDRDSSKVDEWNFYEDWLASLSQELRRRR